MICSNKLLSSHSTSFFTIVDPSLEREFQEHILITVTKQKPFQRNRSSVMERLKVFLILNALFLSALALKLIIILILFSEIFYFRNI